MRRGHQRGLAADGMNGVYIRARLEYVHQLCWYIPLHKMKQRDCGMQQIGLQYTSALCPRTLRIAAFTPTIATGSGLRPSHLTSLPFDSKTLQD